MYCQCGSWKGKKENYNYFHMSTIITVFGLEDDEVRIMCKKILTQIMSK